MTDAMFSNYEGVSPAVEVARDLVKRGLYLVPAAIIVGATIGGGSGIASVLYALALSLGNFVLAAALIGWGARISAVAMGAAAMFGFLIRLSIVFASFLVFRSKVYQPDSDSSTVIMVVASMVSLARFDPRRPFLRDDFAAGSVAACMPLGLIWGRPLRPFSRAISSRSSAFSAFSRALSSRTCTSNDFSSSRPSPSMRGDSAMPTDSHSSSRLGIPRRLTLPGLLLLLRVFGLSL